MKVQLLLLCFCLMLAGCSSPRDPFPADSTPVSDSGRLVPTPSWRGLTSAKPPLQPTSGPGSPTYQHTVVVAKQHEAAERAYWTYEPDSPAPENAPVIVLLHGPASSEPLYYQAWIDHMVKRGNIVIFPTYQIAETVGRDYTANAIRATKAALQQLTVRPDLNKIALVGHSTGGMIAANMAATEAREGLPEPKVLLLVSPAPCASPNCSQMPTERLVTPEDYSRISTMIKLVVLMSANDPLLNDTWAKQFWQQSKQVAATNRDYIIISSDNHGTSTLEADYFYPTAPRSPLPRSEVDALDWYGSWKLLDALSDCGFSTLNCNYALGNTAQQRFMGKWSDGTPVKELQVKQNP